MTASSETAARLLLAVRRATSLYELSPPVLLTKTVRDLRHRTLRSLLTLLGIVVGVAEVVASSFPLFPHAQVDKMRALPPTMTAG